LGFWVLAPIPNPQSPIPNPQIKIKIFYEYRLKIKKLYCFMLTVKKLIKNKNELINYFLKYYFSLKF
jgi:hypothetical protein